MISVLWLLLGLVTFVNGQSTTQPTITSITGCVNCVTSQSITLTGTFLDAKQALVTVNNTQCTWPYNPVQSTDFTRLVCRLDNYQYEGASNQMLPVVVRNLFNNTASEPVNLLSLAPAITAPIVYSIVGCGTSNDSLCDVRSSVVTVIGDGFALDKKQMSVVFVTNQSWTSSIIVASQECATIVNSTMLTFCLNTILPYSLPDTGKLMFFVSHGSKVSSNNFTVWFDTNTARSLAPPPIDASGSPVILTGVSGCVDQVREIFYPPFNQTVNVTTTSECVKHVEFVLSGVNLNRPGLLITIGSERCVVSSSLNVNLTTIKCQLADSLSIASSNQPVSVVVYDMYNNMQSEPFYGATFADITAVPVISSITGCDDQPIDQTNNQSATLNCDASASVTLTGSNFISKGQNWAIITAIAGQNAPISLSFPSDYVLDESTIVVPLSTFKAYMSSIVSTNSRSLSLCLKVGRSRWQVSNCVRMSFAVPTMNISSLDGCTPVYANNETRTSLELVNCFAGTSWLTITGYNLFAPLLVSVGGVQCTNQIVYLTSIRCRLATVPDFEPGFAYDLSVYQSDLDSTYTIPNAITFSLRPTINSITSQFCPPDPRSQLQSLRCEAGDVLTIFGSFFNSSNALSLVMTSSSGRVVIGCINTTVVSDDQVMCVLPSLDPVLRKAVSNSYVSVYVREGRTGMNSNSVQATIYRSVDDPAISEVLGCVSFNAFDRSAVGCKTGNVILINGVNFGSLMNYSTLLPSMLLYDMETSGYYNALNVTIVNSTQIRAILPYVYRSSSIDLMAIQLTLAARNYARSNWFYGVEYSSDLPSDSNTTTIIIDQQSVHFNAYETAYIICLSVLLPITIVMTVAFIFTFRSLHRLRRALKPVRDQVSDSSEMSEMSVGKYELRRGDIEMS